MEIKLQTQSLKNFKGLCDFKLTPNGQNISVFGANGTGKTTLADSFLWILFDKDSTNRKDFSIKTHDSHGQEIHGLEHEVETILLVDGKPLTLRKMFTEKWTKRRGEAEKEFTGHETSYWVDDVPVKKGEYQQKINALIDENVFKLITNPFFFNNQLKWEERRKILLEISGNVSDMEVIDSAVTLSDKSLLDLVPLLNSGKTIDDLKRIIAERIKKLNHEIEKIPVRIDELMKSIGEEQDFALAENSLAHYKDQLKAIESELVDSRKSAEALHQKQQQLYKIQDAIEARKRELADITNAGFKKIVDEKAQLQTRKYKLESEVKALNGEISFKESSIKNIETDLVKLRDRWHDENSKAFTGLDPENCVCPTCKRPFPEEEIERQSSELKTNFDKTKASRLDDINAEGKKLAENKNFAESKITSVNEQLNKAEADLHDINERLAEIDKELANEKPAVANYEEDPQYRELTQQYNTLRAELDKPVEDLSKGLLDKKLTIQVEIENLDKILIAKRIVAKTRERIQELKDEERTLAGQISESEGQRYLIEQFIKAKVNLLEDSINSRFKAVRFKLFDTQINGGIVECCETLVNTNGSWVGWADANNAGRVNAGLDIINTLSKHYGVTAPIFLDNRESVNELIETESQIINLIVTQDPKLRVEVEQ